MAKALLSPPGTKRGPGRLSLALLNADPEEVARLRRWLDEDPKLKSRHTRTNYLLDLVDFNAWRKGRMLTKLLAEQYATHLRDDAKLSPTTVNRRLSAIRWWARRAAEYIIADTSLPREDRDEQVMQAERAAAVEDVDSPDGLLAGRHIPDGELAALMRACAEDETAAGVRDGPILAMAWSSGARRAEIASAWLADLKQIDSEHMELAIEGKGNKQRIVYLSGGAMLALVDWLKLRGKSDGFVFCAILKSGRLLPDHGLTTQSLANMLAKRQMQAGVPHLTWHDFRRTFAGNLLDAGEDIATVQKLLGHASPVTTSNYDRRGEHVRRNAASKLHVPYTQRALLPARKVKK